MEHLLKELRLEKSLEISVCELTEKEKSNIDKLVEDCRVNGFSCLENENDLMRLAVCLNFAIKNTLVEYKKLGIDDTVFYDTMRDIKIWCENNNNKGLNNWGWIKNHLKCELFKLGRLQFQLFNCNIKDLDYSLFPFDYGENLIYIHIPQGEKLIYSDCVKSIQQANFFFEKYFGNHKYNYYFCESWLLYPECFMFMREGCNILQFQSLFSIICDNQDESQAIERIFGKRRIIKALYPQKTSLQKSAKKYMMQGNRLGMGIGIINKSDF